MLTLIDHPLITHKLNGIRDKNCPPERFRQELQEISKFLIYEAVRDFDTEELEIETPLEVIKGQMIKEISPVFVSILRAGNGLLSGALEVLPQARVGFLGMYRDEETLKPVNYYANLPNDLETAPLLILDPMLATGGSSLDAINYLRSKGARDMRLITLVSAPEGVKTIENKYPDLPIFTAALDRKLNEQGFILPGLGDAGDRIFNSH